MAAQVNLPSHPDYVYFKSVDRVQCRPILRGDKAKPTFDSIPTIDVSPISSPDLEVRQKLAEEIGRAAKDVGFFYLVNPPVSGDKMDAAFDALGKFFALPEDVKMKYHVNNSPAAKGFTPVNPADKRAGFGGARESFGMGNDYTNPEQHGIKVASPGTVPLNQWPDEELPEFRKNVYSYFTEVYLFAKQLVRIFSLALGLEETALDQFFETPFTDITINHYPPQPDADEYKQVLYPHADYGAFTLLAQRQIGGLEVLNANAIWVKVRVIEHAFVVNTGSYFELLSGGRWRSTIHRVCAKGNTDRTSLPFFFSPSPSTTIQALVPTEDESLKDLRRNIGKEHVRGFMGDRPTHPFVKKLKALGLSPEDYTGDPAKADLTADGPDFTIWRVLFLSCIPPAPTAISVSPYPLYPRLHYPVIVVSTDPLMLLTTTATSRPNVHPTACRNCRRRGRKCDRTLPTCQSCKDRSCVCEGYVTRWAGVAARGRLRGKTIPVLLDEDTGSKRRVEKGSPSSTALAGSSPETDTPRNRRRQGQDVPENPPDSAALVVERIVPAPVDGLDSFIDYFAYDLSAIPYLGSNPEKSPYLLYVYPLTDRVLPLRYALAASAACHLACRFQNDALQAKSSEWHLKATELLRQRLQSSASPADLGTLMSILMMAQTDMCTGDCAEFDAHIPAAKAFVDEHGPTLPDRSYCEQRLAWLDIMRSTTSDRFLTFTSPDLKRVFSRYQSAPQAREWGNEAFACPIDLLEYIVDITVLYKMQPRGRVFSAAALDKATLLLRRVAAWTARCEYSEQMAHVVSAWHAGIQLYVVRLFRLHQQQGAGDATTAAATVSVDTRELVEQALQPARASRRPDAWSHASLWPLFQAGLWLEDPDDGDERGRRRQLLIQFLHTMLRASGCRQFQVAATTLEMAWKSGEYHDSITAGSFTGSLILG